MYQIVIVLEGNKKVVKKYKKKKRDKDNKCDMKKNFNKGVIV